MDKKKEERKTKRLNIKKTEKYKRIVNDIIYNKKSNKNDNVILANGDGNLNEVYTLNMSDSASDGWDGAFFGIYDINTWELMLPQQITLDSELSEGTDSFSINDGTYYVVAGGGFYDEEITYSIMKNNTEIGTNTLIGGRIYTISFPSLELVEINRDYTLNMYDEYGDGWNGATLKIYNIDSPENILTMPVTLIEEDLYSGNFHFNLPNEGTYRFCVYGGAYDEEIYFSIANNNEESETDFLYANRVYTISFPSLEIVEDNELLPDFAVSGSYDNTTNHLTVNVKNIGFRSTTFGGEWHNIIPITEDMSASEDYLTLPAQYPLNTNNTTYYPLNIDLSGYQDMWNSATISNNYVISVFNDYSLVVNPILEPTESYDITIDCSSLPDGKYLFSADDIVYSQPYGDTIEINDNSDNPSNNYFFFQKGIDPEPEEPEPEEPEPEEPEPVHPGECETTDNIMIDDFHLDLSEHSKIHLKGVSQCGTVTKHDNETDMTTTTWDGTGYRNEYDTFIDMKGTVDGSGKIDNFLKYLAMMYKDKE